MNKELERICFNCNSSFLDRNGSTAYCICLEDPAFEPYIDELFENQDYSRCKKLVREKRILGNTEACEKFSPLEIYGSNDDDNPVQTEK